MEGLFSANPDQGNLPLRIENGIKYRFRNKEYRYERPETTNPSMILYEAGDITKFGEEFWYPAWGKETAFHATSQTRQTYNPNTLVEILLKEGKFLDLEENEIVTRQEWHVLDLTLIEPRDDLWIAPPEGVCVHDVDTETRHIQGLSKTESQRILEGNTAPAQAADLQKPKSSAWKTGFVAINIIVFFTVGIMFLSKYRLAE